MPTPEQPSAPPDRRAPPTVVLCISGSIAAFKAVEIARRLRKAGTRVVPVMTEAGARFVGRATLHALTGEPVRSDMFEAAGAGELHVELASEADVVVVAPATADLVEAMAHGRAGDLVRATLLCTRRPIVVAPAMHPRMWEHPATQRNVEQLRRDGRVELVGPIEGEVANGEIGFGRMADPEAIVAAALGLLDRGRRDPRSPSLVGRHVVVTAGPTVEEIDPVRFLSNRSSGKMGFAVAERARARGARVTLIAGPVALATPAGVARLDVRSAEQMRSALWRALGAALDAADVLVMAAAVADFRPSVRATAKLHRGELGQSLPLELVPNPDLLAEIGHARHHRRPLCVGFSLGTEDDAAAIATARSKLAGKRIDLVVANHADEAFDGDDNRVVFVGPTDVRTLDRMPKRAVADRLLDWVAGELG